MLSAQERHQRYVVGACVVVYFRSRELRSVACSLLAPRVPRKGEATKDTLLNERLIPYQWFHE